MVLIGYRDFKYTCSNVQDSAVMSGENTTRFKSRNVGLGVKLSSGALVA